MTTDKNHQGDSDDTHVTQPRRGRLSIKRSRTEPYVNGANPILDGGSLRSGEEIPLRNTVADVPLHYCFGDDFSDD